MKSVGPATGDEMVLAFLRAEIDSPRFAAYYESFLMRDGLARTALIDAADLTDAVANAIRARMLGEIRGYRRNATLFRGFPDAPAWRRIEIEAGDGARLRYARHRTWIELSGGTLRVADGARNLAAIRTDATEHILAIADQLARGATFPELVAIEMTAGDLVLIEGHARATAWLHAGMKRPLPALTCREAEVPGWAFY